MVDLELYKIFYTVAKCGSITRAAEQLFISQPAVSQAIKQLETQLNTPLFKRVHRGMELTAKGGALIFDDIERALNLLAGAEEKLSELNSAATGTLRIGASETIFQFILAPVIAEYRSRYPAVKIELVSDISPRIATLLKDDRCDIGFLNLPFAEEEGIELLQSVFRLDDVFVAGAAFGSLKGVDLTLRDIGKYPLVLLGENTAARAAFDRFTASLGVKLSPAVEVNSWGLMKQLVERGVGIGCIPRQYAARRLKEDLLFELSVSPSLPPRSVGMAVRKDEGKSFALRAFIDLIKG